MSDLAAEGGRIRVLGPGDLSAVAEDACQRQAPCLGLPAHPENAQAVGFHERLGRRRVGNDGGWTGTMEKALDT